MQKETQAGVGKLKYYLDFPSLSFSKKFFKDYFNTLIIIKGFFIASILSLFILLSFFDISYPIINSILAILGFYLLLKEEYRSYFWVGFFIGIFWFYWIAYSLVYYDLTYLIPIEIFFIGVIYGIIFAIIGIFQNPFIRSILLVFLSYLYPFDFNWLILEVTLIESYFGISKIEFLIFLFSISLFIKSDKKFKPLAVIPLIALILFNFYQTPKTPTNNLKIKISKKFIKQEDRWDEKKQDDIIQDSLDEIYKAINEKYDIVILTESAFPLILNESVLVEKLKKLSKEIIIVAGSIFRNEEGYYNANYYFIDGRMEIAKKVFLVPFGEKVPLPQFLTKFINKIFYAGAEDYLKADEFFDIDLKDVLFRNAICFEVTRDELYQNSPDFIIANSNNGWFYPSTEPILQNLLIKFFAKKYNKVIYHSANMGISGVIKAN